MEIKISLRRLCGVTGGDGELTLADLVYKLTPGWLYD